jgi:transcriptional repressor NrdR
MAKLHELDQIAYIRFASVYQSFEGIEDLKREVDALIDDRDAIPLDLPAKVSKRRAS